MSVLFRLPVLAGMVLFSLTGCGEDATEQGHAKRVEKQHLVEVATVEATPLSFTTVRTGTLKARKRVRIFNQEEGRIDKITVREGDTVKAGDVLIELDRMLLSAELAKARATRKESAGNLARVLELSRRKVTTQERLDKAQTALSVAKAEESLIRTRMAYSKITAPFDGIVTERLAEPGDVAARNTHLLSVIDPNSLYTDVSVSELMIPALRQGGNAEVRIDALGNEVWPGRIVRIHPVIDPRTRQGIVEVDLDPAPPGAVAGQLSRISLSTPAVERLVIPFAALRNDGEGQFVYGVVDGKAQVKRIRPGLRIDDRVEILDGLEAGVKVVIRGFLDISPGKKVSVVDK
ncbi:MAG: efflux RND transporter periplasmic adaptor subunit [Alphaproteobacteria bacterium]